LLAEVEAKKKAAREAEQQQLKLAEENAQLK
jgi:hypothetical protein